MNSVTGTSGEIAAAPTTGAVVLSLPATITSNENFTGTLQQGGSTISLGGALTTQAAFTQTGAGAMTLAGPGSAAVFTTPGATATLAGLGTTQTFSGTDTFSATLNVSGTFQKSGTAQTFPTSGIIVGTTDTQTLTNKTLTAPTLTSPTITGALTATGLVTNADLVNAATTVNGQTCTLGLTCTITASAGTITVGTTTIASGTTNYLLYNNAGTLGNEATLAAAQEPAHTGDMTNSAGSLTTAVGHVNGVSYPTSPSTNTVPVVTAANTTTYEQLPAAALASGVAVANLGFTPLNPANNGSDFASVPTALATIEGGAPTVVTATGAQAVTSGETNIDWNPATPAATTFTLPASPIAGEEHTFKDLISSGTFPMEIKGNTSPAQTIDGNAYIVLVYANDTRKIKYAGSKAWIIVH